jgi:hypothetical protein
VLNLLERAKAAYAATGLIPTRGTTLEASTERFRGRACALGAIACHEGGCKDNLEAYDWCADNLPSSYRFGFIHGFDGRDANYISTTLNPKAIEEGEYARGWEDGRAAARELVRGES